MNLESNKKSQSPGPASARAPAPLPAVVVLGGLGFVGSHLCEQLLDSRVGQVVAIDNGSPAHRQNWEQLRTASAQNVLAQITADPSQMDYAELAGHVAARVRGEVGYVFLVLDSAAASAAISSAALSSGAAAPAASGSLLSEGLPAVSNALRLADDLGARAVVVTLDSVPLAVARAAEAQVHTHNLRGSRRGGGQIKVHGALRVASVYGPRMSGAGSSELLRLFSQVLRNESALPNHIAPARDQDLSPRAYCYVRDAVEGILAYARRADLDEVCTLCGPTLYSVPELRRVAQASRTLAHQEPSAPLPGASFALSFVSAGAEPPAFRRTRQILDWAPRVDLQSGAVAVMKWMQDSMPVAFAQARHAPLGSSRHASPDGAFSNGASLASSRATAPHAADSSGARAEKSALRRVSAVVGNQGSSH